MNTNSSVRSGLIGGLWGGIVIWIYEAVVWVGWQHQMPLLGISRNATGLIFGKQVQESLGLLSHLIGIGVHFGFSLLWGLLFALIWPSFRKRGWEATLLALPFAIVAWIVMHAAIMLVSDNHPDYLDPTVVIGGFMSHFFFAVPMALVIKQRMAQGATSPERT